MEEGQEAQQNDGPRQPSKRAPITPIACDSCRKRKSKCDGKRPTCMNCRIRGISSCAYEIDRTVSTIRPLRIQNEKLKNEIAALRDQLETARVAESSSGADRRHAQHVGPLDHRGQGRRIEEDWVVEWAERPTSGFASSQSHVDPLNQPSNTSESSFTSTTASRVSSESHVPRIESMQEDHMTYGSIPSSPLISEHTDTGRDESWTTVTNDAVLINHVLSLFFCWEFPTYANFSEKPFYQDFHAGRRKYCSSLLVNVLLSLGCRFSDKAEAQLRLEDGTSASDRFFEEAKILLPNHIDGSLTTVQALGLMSLLEASRGQDCVSRFYALQSMRMAVETGLHLDPIDCPRAMSHEELEVRSATFWGCFNLNQCWSLLAGEIPYMSRQKIRVPVPVGTQEPEGEKWTAYTDHGLSPAAETTSSSKDTGLLFRHMCELSTQINDTLHVLYAPEKDLNPQKISDFHAQYLHWYGSMSETLRRGRNFSPCALFAHLYYHCAILLLFRPFIYWSFTSSLVSPLEICRQAVRNINALTHSYSQLHTLRRTPSFMPHILLNMQIVALADDSIADPQGLPPGFGKNLDDLRAVSASHQFATHAIRILQFFARQKAGSTDAHGLRQHPWMNHAVLEDPAFQLMTTFTPSKHLHGTSDGPLDARLFAPFPFQGLPLMSAEAIAAQNHS